MDAYETNTGSPFNGRSQNVDEVLVTLTLFSMSQKDT